MYNLILTWIYQHSTLILAAQTFTNWKHRLMLWTKSLVNFIFPSGMKVPNACSNREITKQHTFKLGKREARLTEAMPYPVQPTPKPSVTQWFWMLLAVSNFWIVQSTKNLFCDFVVSISICLYAIIYDILFIGKARQWHFIKLIASELMIVASDSFDIMIKLLVIK